MMTTENELTIADLIDTSFSMEDAAEWHDVLDKEVLECSPGDGEESVGANAWPLIRDAQRLIDAMPDVRTLDPDMLGDVRRTVARQCGVFYFG